MWGGLLIDVSSCLLPPSFPGPRLQASGIRARGSLALLSPSNTSNLASILVNRYVPSRSDVILYVIRLVVRVAGFVGFMLDPANQVRRMGLASF